MIFSLDLHRSKRQKGSCFENDGFKPYLPGSVLIYRPLPLITDETGDLRKFPHMLTHIYILRIEVTAIMRIRTAMTIVKTMITKYNVQEQQDKHKEGERGR